MANQVLAAVPSSQFGVDISTAALVAATSNVLQFVNGGGQALVVNNGGANALTVTPIITNASIEGVLPVAPPRSVPAGKTWLIGSFSPRDYNGGSAGTTVSTPAVPATTVLQYNTTGQGVVVTITGGTMTNVSVNGATVGAGAGTYYVPPGGNISMTYSVAPTWAWAGVGSTLLTSMLVALGQLTSVAVGLTSIPVTSP